MGRGKWTSGTGLPKIVPSVWPVPFRKWTTAKRYAIGRSQRALRYARGVSARKRRFATIRPISHGQNSNVGMGNQLARARMARTVGLYTERKPVRASSATCAQKARHRKSQARPKLQFCADPGAPVIVRLRIGDYFADRAVASAAMVIITPENRAPADVPVCRRGLVALFSTRTSCWRNLPDAI